MRCGKNPDRGRDSTYDLTGGTGDAGFVLKSGRVGCVSYVYRTIGIAHTTQPQNYV